MASPLEPSLCHSEPWREGPSEAWITIGWGCTECMPSPGSWALSELGCVEHLPPPRYIQGCSPGLMVTRHSETVNKSECMSQPEAKEKGPYLPLQTALPSPKAYHVQEFLLTFRDLFLSFCNLYLSMSSSPGFSVHGDSPRKNIGVGCHALLQGIFPTQGSNPGLLHCWQVLYSLSHQRSPIYVYKHLNIYVNMFIMNPYFHV